ncbi:aspartyl-phosphate phosphatase Spo0E family protein [Paenibacillus pasadenensis]|uniref:aspartyl-phosphate phosphatase Spo0E family protein n=1 Tax=Paenibacillus pasadenensis TaxID=217090 RepID=UPI00203D1A00|nr:aspartyl-phosphate phosphatase Spo0E family protein [Paenibacillus pasadenensis]MCM3746818.1 aspartyl-phosphate phosphatase Spo0E family protein [Paenibacillus pasadenensis]
MTTGMKTNVVDEAEPKSVSAVSWTPFLQGLAEEIDALRKEMEQTFEQGSGFQSELLLSMSQKLDIKINEFLHHRLT